MKYLEYNVKGMAISRATGDKTTLISGAVNYFGVHFTFDEEFEQISGQKACEFYKNRKTVRVDLVDEQCAIPNEFLTDKSPFEMRVVSGTMVGTPWISVNITESGVIMPEQPEEPEPGTEWVKTISGAEAVAALKTENGKLMFSTNGKDFIPGLSGVPEVPDADPDKTYVRKHGDWVEVPAGTAVEGLQGVAAQVEDLDPGADITEAVTKINELLGQLRIRGVIAT